MGSLWPVRSVVIQKGYMSRKVLQSIEVYNEQGELVETFTKTKDAAKAYGVTPPTLIFRMKKGKYYNGFLFKCGGLIFDDEPYTRKGVDIPKGFEEEHTLLNYESYGRVCLTPCQFKESPKPKIGSVLCQCCHAFCGINREKQQVACNLSKK